MSLHQIFLSSREWLDGPHGCTLLWHVLAVAWAWCVMDRNILFNIFYYLELFWILVSQHHWELECKSPRCWLWTSSWTGTWPWPWSPPWSGRGALSQTPPRSRASHGCSILQEYFDITSLLSSVTPPYLYDINSNSPSGGMKDIVLSFSNLDNLTHWWNLTSSNSTLLLLPRPEIIW